MAIVMYLRFAALTPLQYDEVARRTGWDSHPGPGARCHIATFDMDGLRVTDVWESVAAWQEFERTRLDPALLELGIHAEPHAELRPLHACWSPPAEVTIPEPRADEADQTSSTVGTIMGRRR